MWRGVAIFLLSTCSQEVLAGYGEKQYFTTNAICLRKHCINPIFPGLEDLGRLSQSPWFCSSLFKARAHMGFCKAAINYDPSFPLAEGAAQQSLEDIVKRQDGDAAKMFMYHLSGMGLEAWDYSKPEFSDDDCVKSVWRMVCYTYFPRAPIGCQDGMQVPYMRPCRSSCQNYIKTCGVECCDESVQCVFTHTKELSPTQMVTTSGYLPHDGPSTLCTGAARRSASPAVGLSALMLLPLLWTDAAAVRVPRLLQFGVLAAVPLLLQGCNYDVPSHTVGNWRAQKDYLIGFQFVMPGASARDGVLNSCDVENLALPLQCSGRGVCKTWDKEDLHSPTTFCECDRDWADPECNTRRKSQLGAFLLSLFFGYLGLDHFYMGYRVTGAMKLLSLGGGGLWWVFDFIRIGSAPIAAKNFKLAADLPHWVFVLTVVFFGMVLGFSIAYATVKRRITHLHKDAMMHAEEEEAYHPAPEKKRPPRKPEKPELRIGEPGMQLKFRANPAKLDYPSYGAIQERSPAAPARRPTPPSSTPVVVQGAPSPQPRVVTSATVERSAAAPPAVPPPRSDVFSASYNMPSVAGAAVTDSVALFNTANRGRVLESSQPVPTLGPMEPLASDMSLQDSAFGPRVDVVSPVAAAGPRGFTPSSISGLGVLPTSSARVVQ